MVHLRIFIKARMLEHHSIFFHFRANFVLILFDRFLQRFKQILTAFIFGFWERKTKSIFLISIYSTHYTQTHAFRSHECLCGSCTALRHLLFWSMNFVANTLHQHQHDHQWERFCNHNKSGENTFNPFVSGNSIFSRYDFGSVDLAGFLHIKIRTHAHAYKSLQPFRTGEKNHTQNKGYENDVMHIKYRSNFALTQLYSTNRSLLSFCVCLH